MCERREVALKILSLSGSGNAFAQGESVEAITWHGGAPATSGSTGTGFEGVSESLYRQRSNAHSTGDGRKIGAPGTGGCSILLTAVLFLEPPLWRLRQHTGKLAIMQQSQLSNALGVGVMVDEKPFTLEQLCCASAVHCLRAGYRTRLPVMRGKKTSRVTETGGLNFCTRSAQMTVTTLRLRSKFETGVMQVRAR
jgi:hypothetical protein